MAASKLRIYSHLKNLCGTFPRVFNKILKNPKRQLFAVNHIKIRTFVSMFDKIGQFIINAADVLGGYPLFFLLIGGGLYLLVSSGFVSLRCLPAAMRELRRKPSKEGRESGQISSIQALA